MKVWIPVLAILGGIAGVVSGFLVTAGGAMFGNESMANDGAAVFWLSALSIFLGFLSWKWQRISGWSLILIAIIGFFMNGLFFTFAFIFLLLAGILSLTLGRKLRRASEAI
ncbi:CHASE2 domain-containing sensor protein [Bacillus pakistanensis]|uniref:CHASE2 domain-containing sensor protein n=1 Tax=Rossellomorea pakistanensis TaxID=992288 RepID=A0ABS2NIT1_9BACI|nr:hypothetical protein [Bacillus pakistanensis]MBM7587744.1 CHASE2 domain-containing sensor protein [Bacillus pakistanensis]